MLSRLPPSSAQISGTGAVTVRKFPDSESTLAAIRRFESVAIALPQLAHKVWWRNRFISRSELVTGSE